MLTTWFGLLWEGGEGGYLGVVGFNRFFSFF